MAYVICLKVYDINATVYQNSAKTVSSYEAQSLGAGKYENIKKGLHVGFLQCMFSLGVYFTGAWKTDEIKAILN